MFHAQLAPMPTQVETRAAPAPGPGVEDFALLFRFTVAGCSGLQRQRPAGFPFQMSTRLVGGSPRSAAILPHRGFRVLSRAYRHALVLATSYSRSIAGSEGSAWDAPRGAVVRKAQKTRSMKQTNDLARRLPKIATLRWRGHTSRPTAAIPACRNGGSLADLERLAAPHLIPLPNGEG